MFKVVGLLKRPKGMAIEEFKNWWLKDHAEKVKKWPGLKRYHINLSVTADQECDGMAEGWFETREVMENVFGTSEGETERQSASNGSDKLVILLTEEQVMVRGLQSLLGLN